MAQQDNMIVLTLLHAIESRVLAQAAKRLCDLQDFKDLGEQALDIAVTSQVYEDEALNEISGLLDS
jgi:hypothetical protein